MKSFANEIFKSIHEPESFDELMGLVVEAAPDTTSLVRMWRGQADAAWGFDSAAYRRIKLSGTRVTEMELVFYEDMLLKRAKHKGFHHMDGYQLSDLELLSRLQHHGAATRLVDFTRSAFVALWFCVSASPNQTGILAGIHAHYVGGYEGRLDEREYAEVVKDLHKYTHPMTWEPPVVTPRIAAQHSQFVYSDISSDATGSLKLPQQDISRLFIAITPAMKSRIKTILNEVFDISAITIFPDFDGFCLSNNPSIIMDDMMRW